MMTTEHWAIVGQTFVLGFAVLGIVLVAYLAIREVNR